MTQFVTTQRVRLRIAIPGFYFIWFHPKPPYPGGWWFRLGSKGPGISYDNMSTGDWERFSERQGWVRTWRIGHHKFTYLRTIRVRKAR